MLPSYSSSPSAHQSPLMAAAHPPNRYFSSRSPFARLLFFTFLCVAVFIFTVHPTIHRAARFTEHLEHINVVPSPSEGQTLPPTESSVPVPEPPLPDCSLNTSRLQSLQQRYGLTQQIEYGQRYMRFRRQDIDRKPLTEVDEDLFPEEFEELDTADLPESSVCHKPVEIPVPNSPFPSTVNASDLLFGISTTYKRLYDEKISPLHEWAYWLTDGKGNSNGGGLILRLVDASDEEIEQTRQKLNDMGMDVQVFASNSSIAMAQRYLSLLPALYSDATRKPRKWLVMCDDDTFFPSMHSLLARLSTYDHKSDLYIGTLSEDVNNIQRHGSQAFGGAGVFFSVHLASVVAKLYDQCSTPEKIRESNTGWGPQGDILLRKCIYEHTEVRLTLLRELHQLDIMGDPAGFYESGLAPLSLHHFKGGIWHKAKPYAGAQINHACGEDCFLQRYLTKDNFIVSNGFSVAYYPRGIQFDVNQMERTFHAAPDDHGWNLDFMLGPGRGNLAQTGRKVAWELAESIHEADGVVRQVYIRKAGDSRWTDENEQALFDLDGIVELIWIS